MAAHRFEKFNVYFKCESAISNDRFSVRIFRFCRLREYWVNVTFVSK